MARTAVMAGTATAGAINRHSQNKARAAVDEQAKQQPAEQAPAPAAVPDPVAALKQLADLKEAGALTDAEFAAAKSKLLGV